MATEAASADPLQRLEQDQLAVINEPFQTVLGRPLIGNGANAAPGSGQNGGAGVVPMLLDPPLTPAPPVPNNPAAPPSPPR